MALFIIASTTVEFIMFRSSLWISLELATNALVCFVVFLAI